MDNQMDKRFENLAILEATGKISAEETSNSGIDSRPPESEISAQFR